MASVSAATSVSVIAAGGASSATEVSTRISCPRIDPSSGVGTMGTGGGYIVPPSSGLVPPVPPPQVKDAAYVKKHFKQTTLTTRLYKFRTDLYAPHLRKRSDAPGPARQNRRCRQSLTICAINYGGRASQRGSMVNSVYHALSVHLSRAIG